MKAAILTVSDRCARGEAKDRSGRALRRALATRGIEVVGASLVADEKSAIQEQLLRMSDELAADVVLTTGGTGLGPRDVTPEATEAVVERRVPGIAEAIRAGSLAKTVTAMLSRGTAGLRGRTLIVNLPGSPRGAVECLEILWPALGHAVEMIQGGGHPEEARENDAASAPPG
ncbi:MAG: MogA/MoaB family molybdenum cofactor biosynthesis protein [Armatimonadota bacterium]|nr:MAG: MogA/MoaB family molybdenum cofactor biosynthesis protein [Armatimonadota bacterium]